MPQISKLRVVNFQYNDGKRLIADELYNFEDGKKVPSDVLINLANGGGKSVLVQLMMQPVIPKAKVAGRKIESFFTKVSDHCYVAIEWSLDGSRMKLMTGIAMAASDTADHSDQDRGFHIKYYTFISSYENYQGNYNIVSLPLSRKENGRFIPAAFDDVRNLAKKSGGALDRYASDDSVKWKERLAQYGIIQNEWRMIEELNSNEDGLSKYFSSLKSSDAVIDKLIIPRIEEKQRHGVSRDDSSLETMLISYAKQFSRQQEIIRERDVCAGFFDMLGLTRAEAEELWKSNDSMEKSIGELFGYVDALGVEIAKREEQSEKLEKEGKKCSEDISHIKWEKASADFYKCSTAFERESEKLRDAEAARAEAGERWEEAQKKVRIIECAYYYGQQKQIENEIKAILDEIDSREKNAESAEKLASLKYSALCAIRKKMESVSPLIEGLTSEKEALEENGRELERELTDLQKKISGAVEDRGRADALYEKQKEDDDAAVEHLGIDAIRTLDGKYQTQDLDSWKKGVLEKERTAEAAMEEVSNAIREMEERRDSLPQKIADVKNQIKDTSVKLNELREEITEYKKAEEGIKAVCDRHGLDFGMRFSGHARKYLEEQISLAAASIGDFARKIEVTEEKISAVKRGILHIPKMLSDFLDSTGLRYTSVEKYLLTQLADGHISEEKCGEILAKYPYAAYGVILDRADIEILYQESEDSWLPAVLPVFAAEDINQLLKGEAPSFSGVSAYAREYFKDSASYADRLMEERDKLCDGRTMQEARKEALQADAEAAGRFEGYDAGWPARALSEEKRLGDEIGGLKKNVAELEREKTELKEKTDSYREKEKQIDNEINDIQKLLSEFELLLKRLEEEDSLYIEYENAARELRELERAQKKKNSEKQNLDARVKDLSVRLKEQKEIEGSLRKGYEKISDAREAEIMEGEWDALLTQYEKLLEAQSAELKRLKDDRDRLFKEKGERQREIQRRNCSREEYEDLLYTKELEEEASDREKRFKAVYKEADEDRSEKKVSFGIAENSMKEAERRLSDFGGEALPESEVGSGFDARIFLIKKRLNEIEAERRALDREYTRLQKVMGRAEAAAGEYIRPARYSSILLEKNFDAQLKTLSEQIRRWKDGVEKSRHRVSDSLRRMTDLYEAASTDVGRAIGSMRNLLESEEIRGDRYYTLCEHIDANMHTAELRISQIDTDLREFHKTKDDLIHQCVIQGRRMYEGLMQLSGSSKVKVQGKRRQMIRFDIPDAVDENTAVASIAAEIERGTEEIVAKMADDSHTESEVLRLALGTVGSRRLLRRYIGAENIVLKAYKIDRNPDNSGYRTWEQTQINNSGAEKFVVYFAVILALMSYARDSYEGLDRSVLVLDNPFGPISSKHVLEPMFEISRNYKVQMICLSDISKSDIVTCFDLVIRAVVKQFALSSREQLTHDGNETIEHGFYRSEQINLFK